MMLQAAQRSPGHLQTLSCLSHVLSVNLLCEENWCQWRTCRFWCSLANASQTGWCLTVSTGPKTGRRTLMPPLCSLFLTVIHTAYWRSFWRALAVLHLFLLAQKNKYQSCCWVVCCLSVVPSSSPCVTGLPPISRPCSLNCAGRHTKPPYNSTYGWDYLCNLIGLQVLPHATSSHKDPNKTQKTIICSETNQSGRIEGEQLSVATIYKTSPMHLFSLSFALK